MPGWLAARPEYDTWQRSNRWILHHAWATTTTDRVTVLALWNGQLGDGKGGVADMVAPVCTGAPTSSRWTPWRCSGCRKSPVTSLRAPQLTSGDAIDLLEARTGTSSRPVRPRPSR